MNKALEFTRRYVDEYNKQIKEEEGHNRFDDFSETNKASISALGLFLFSLEEHLSQSQDKESDKSG